MEQVIAWLHEKNPGLDGPIAADEDLIEARLIDSMDFLEFIDLLEEISGATIDLQEVTIDDFRTLTRVGERFLGSAGLAEAAAE
ncbi:MULTISPECIES: acetyl xylan esterase [Streptomyces]|uniref:acetyl xylan esterase n=1 Tax=Streptomyces TaxID=1883 RepID=UPI000D518537|nr:MULTISPECIES: acetyl xylan esterase [Streptomyces]MXG26196.1 acyl carrier protein [Streptomyces sp. YIM 132580]NYS20372.1 acyl carrier protein [Streptomyces sp. SJ1-7]PVC64234.1 acetyl xylan esterase [Streptomyces sp. CS065A]